MKKLELPNKQSFDSIELVIPMYHKINKLIDLVNSQQEAIERLEKLVGVGKNINPVLIVENKSTDDKPVDDTALSSHPEWIANINKSDTHRTVTLRVPKGMRIGQAIWRVHKNNGDVSLVFSSDTDLQKALDEVEHE